MYIPFSAYYTSCLYLTDVIIRAPCGFVAKAEHELNEWMPNDGGVFINAKDNGNSLIQCKRTNNWTLGVLAVKCHDRNKIVLRCVMDAKCSGLMVHLVFRQMETTFFFTIKGINKFCCIYWIYVTTMTCSDRTCELEIGVSQLTTSNGIDVLVTVHPPTCDGWRNYKSIVYSLKPVDTNTDMELKSHPVPSLNYTFKDAVPGTYDIQADLQNQCKKHSTANFRYTVSGSYIIHYNQMQCLRLSPPTTQLV